MTPPLADYVLSSLALLLVLALALGLAIIVLRRAGLPRSMGSIELLARLPLEARRSVYVIRVVDQILIIGSSEAGLSKLGELPENALGELVSVAPRPDFASVLARLTGQKAPSDKAGPR